VIPVQLIVSKLQKAGLFAHVEDASGLSKFMMGSECVSWLMQQVCFVCFVPDSLL
jgi:hypothetical protein